MWKEAFMALPEELPKILPPSSGPEINPNKQLNIGKLQPDYKLPNPRRKYPSWLLPLHLLISNGK
jgi:hypothetical protein